MTAMTADIPRQVTPWLSLGVHPEAQSEAQRLPCPALWQPCLGKNSGYRGWSSNQRKIISASHCREFLQMSVTLVLGPG